MVRVTENDPFFHSDEWKEYITKGYEETDTPPTTSFFTKKQEPQSIYWKWKGEGKQPKLGNYYCKPSFTREFVQTGPMSSEEVRITNCEWILVGNKPKNKPFERDLVSEEYELYNKYIKEERRKWKERQPQREENEAEEINKRREEEKKRVQESAFKEEQDYVFRIVGTKAGEEAKKEFIKTRGENPEISVQEFLKTNYEISSGGKRRTTRKARKSRK